MPELIFLDLEWNTAFYRNREGERVSFHELIEVAAMKVDQATGAMLDSFHSYVHPTVSRRIENRTYRLLPYEREELTQLLADAPTFLDLGPDFIHWCGEHPIFIEWGNNDVDVLMKNFEFHRLSFDQGWSFTYFDLQYMYQKLFEGDLGCQPSLEKAVVALGMDTELDFHSAWNDTYYTVMVYQHLLDRFEGLIQAHRNRTGSNGSRCYIRKHRRICTQWYNGDNVSDPCYFCDCTMGVCGIRYDTSGCGRI